MTSSRVSGDGSWVCPTNPVTPGVCRTADQDWSVRSIRTRTYPGNLLRRTFFRWPFLISTVSSVGTSTWKMKSSIFSEAVRFSRLALTRFS